MTSRTATLDSMLCFDIYAANLAFGRIYKPLLDRLGLTYPQFLVLMCLWTEDARSVGALGHALSLDSSTLTPMLKRLEAQGLLTRRRDSADERRVIVTLTDQGLALEDAAQGVVECAARDIGLALPEQRQLHDLLARLRANITGTG